MSRGDLSGAERRQLSQALIAAFERDDLERLVDYTFDRDLATITDPDDLEDAAFNLVKWAIRQGRLADLVNAAMEENPGNPDLVQFRQGVWEAESAAVESSRRAETKPDVAGANRQVGNASARNARHEVARRLRSRRRVVGGAAASLAGGSGLYALWQWLDDPEPGPDPIPDPASSSPSGRTPTVTPTSQTALPTPTPGPTPTAGQPPFATARLPFYEDHLIPDDQSQAWYSVGPRKVKGVVLHRLQASLEGADAYYHSPVSQTLLDYGVDNQTGEVWRWNDPFGEPHPEVGASADRAPWAQGNVFDSSGDALAFVDAFGADGETLNRDLVSIGIAGQYPDPISDACIDAVASLIAFLAYSVGISADAFPEVTGAGFGFVHLHSDFDRDTLCPGPVVADAREDIVGRANEILPPAQDESGGTVSGETRQVIVIAAGHRSTGDAGDPTEESLTPGLALAYADALSSAGHEVHFVQQEDGDQDPDDTVGGLDTVGEITRDLCRQHNATIVLDLHYDSGGPAGVYAVVPDGTGLTSAVAYRDPNDLWENNVRDRELARAITFHISRRTGLPLRTSEPLREAGVLSESQSGVGTQGYRLAMFAYTADLQPKPVRLIVEHGSLTDESDRAIIDQNDFPQLAAGAAVDAIAEVF